jgi:small subunit ribosomal protein S4
MSRFSGPRVKKMRSFGVELPGLSRKKIEKRPYPPGQHGQARKKQTEFGRRLMEKQKLRFNYGISERQLRRVFTEAKGGKQATGSKLLELLERRLDNVTFRAGFAATIPAARQLVQHGHFLVNGKRVNVPSFRVSSGDVIELRDASKKIATAVASMENPSLERPTWVDFDGTKATAKITANPDETSVPFPIDVQLVVEYYSQRI